MTKAVVGIDVGKGQLDVSLNGQKRVQAWANDEAGQVEVSEWVVRQKASLVVVEASGGYEAALVSELVARVQVRTSMYSDSGNGPLNCSGLLLF